MSVLGLDFKKGRRGERLRWDYDYQKRGEDDEKDKFGNTLVDPWIRKFNSTLLLFIIFL